MPYTFLTPVNMAGLEVRDVRAETVGALPTADGTQAGRYVYHSGQLEYCNGSAWIILGAEGAGGPPSGTAGGDLNGSFPNPQVTDDSHAHTGTTISALDAADTTTGVFGTARLASTGTPSATTFLRGDQVWGTPVISALSPPTVLVDWGGQRLNNLGTPTSASDATTKAYVDNLSAGLSWKDSARAATTANITLSAPQTVDGVAVIATERVLVKNQTTPAENGIYTVAAGAWVRATDADAAGELEGAAVFVLEGTTQADTAWVCTTNAPITVGTTGLVFAQFGAGTAVVGGAGLTLTANTLDVGAGSGITVAADSVAVDGAVVELLSRKGAVSGYALLDASSRVPVANLPTTIPKSFVGNVGAGTAVVVNHALATRDVKVEVYRSTTPWDTVLCDVERTDTNNVTLRFAVSVAANAYRCVVMGV